MPSIHFRPSVYNELWIYIILRFFIKNKMMMLSIYTYIFFCFLYTLLYSYRGSRGWGVVLNLNIKRRNEYQYMIIYITFPYRGSKLPPTSHPLFVSSLKYIIKIVSLFWLYLWQKYIYLTGVTII